MQIRSITIILLYTMTACGTAGPDSGTKAEVASAEEEVVPSAVDRSLTEYSVEDHFRGTAKDTLLANMITFIYKRPSVAINRDRTLPEFRQYYVEQLPRFNLAYHTMAADSIHWFYLIRPARSVEGDKRGVGGWFRTNQDLDMVEFVEVFNTRIMPEPELLERGLSLFEHMMANTDVESHPKLADWVEWPDDRLKYDREKREWRYID